MSPAALPHTLTPPLTLASDLGGWTHDLSPIALDLGFFQLRWYGLSYLAGFVVAYLLLRFLAKRGAAMVPAHRVFDAILTLVVGVVVGGRLGYVLLYDPRLFGLIDGFPFWGVLAINRGGMASHGGIVGVIVAAWWVSRGFKEPDGSVIGRCPPLHAMDLCAMIAPAGLFFGRLANFVNGELLGGVAAQPGAHAPWWAVRYPQEILPGAVSHPAQTDAQLDRIALLGLDHALPNEDWVDGCERLIRAIQHGDHAATAALEPLLSARYPTQLMQACLDGLLVGVVVWIVAARPRRPGVIGAWFLITYAIGRVAMDFVRLPDAGISQFGSITRGQVYSGLMLLGGVLVLAYAVRSQGPRVSGGWRRRDQVS